MSAESLALVLVDEDERAQTEGVLALEAASDANNVTDELALHHISRLDLLVEAAWHYLPQPSEGPTIAARRAGQPDHVIQIAHRAERRLHRQYARLRARGKPGNVTTVAVARELVCFCWAAEPSRV